jgi:hypothetical protein
MRSRPVPRSGLFLHWIGLSCRFRRGALWERQHLYGFYNRIPKVVCRSWAAAQTASCQEFGDRSAIGAWHQDAGSQFNLYCAVSDSMRRRDIKIDDRRGIIVSKFRADAWWSFRCRHSRPPRFREGNTIGLAFFCEGRASGSPGAARVLREFSRAGAPDAVEDPSPQSRM